MRSFQLWQKFFPSPEEKIVSFPVKWRVPCPSKAKSSIAPFPKESRLVGPFFFFFLPRESFSFFLGFLRTKSRIPPSEHYKLPFLFFFFLSWKEKSLSALLRFPLQQGGFPPFFTPSLFHPLLVVKLRLFPPPSFPKGIFYFVHL